MKQQIYNTALYLRLSRDDMNYRAKVPVSRHKETCCVCMQKNIILRCLCSTGI